MKYKIKLHLKLKEGLSPTFNARNDKITWTTKNKITKD